MDYSRAAAISASGMVAQKVRIEAAALNLANMNTTAPAGGVGYRPVATVIRSQPANFPEILEQGAGSLSLAHTSVVPSTHHAPRRALEPGHPDADADGMVSYPAIDHAREMLTIAAALRGYEANLAALQASRTLALKALEIGGQT